ncbi:hypothetical protein OH77DRAFT_170880 [Trametes cingulata]|nr:hypothetical protein OH77DRAFT_170880 [Trametes cingulata]
MYRTSLHRLARHYRGRAMRSLNALSVRLSLYAQTFSPHAPSRTSCSAPGWQQSCKPAASSHERASGGAPALWSSASQRMAAPASILLILRPSPAVPIPAHEALPSRSTGLSASFCGNGSLNATLPAEGTVTGAPTRAFAEWPRHARCGGLTATAVRRLEVRAGGGG